MTLAQVWESFSETFQARVAKGTKAPRTYELYEQRWNSHIRDVLGNKPVQSLNVDHIEALLAKLEAAKLSPWTRQGVLVVLSAVLSHAVGKKMRLIPRSPVQDLDEDDRPKGENVRTIRMLTPQEVSAVVAATTERWKPVFLTAQLTGARISEILGLRWKDVDTDPESPVMEVSISTQLGRDGKPRPLKTKNSKRKVRVGPELRRILLAQFMASADKSPRRSSSLTTAMPLPTTTTPVERSQRP